MKQLLMGIGVRAVLLFLALALGLLLAIVGRMVLPLLGFPAG